ncbi:MAG: hypothetical protein R3F50_09330 [Gammaproteobacteria bacterium]|jgi:hypothetical protein
MANHAVVPEFSSKCTILTTTLPMARAVSIAGGVEIPLVVGLSLSTVLNFDILDPENCSRCQGTLRTTILQPSFENLIA